MTYLHARHVDLLCDGCGRLFTGRLDEQPDAIRRRASTHGWWLFDHRDLCPSCAHHYRLED